jgi:hypothetical protein
MAFLGASFRFWALAPPNQPHIFGVGRRGVRQARQARLLSKSCAQHQGESSLELLRESQRCVAAGLKLDVGAHVNAVGLRFQAQVYDAREGSSLSLKVVGEQVSPRVGSEKIRCGKRRKEVK